MLNLESYELDKEKF